MKNTLLGVGLLCLTMSLTGCATPPPEVIRVPFEKTVIEKQRLPDELLRECPEPNLDAVETNKDLEAVAIEALASLSTCNEDKARAREWQEDN